MKSAELSEVAFTLDSFLEKKNEEECFVFLCTIFSAEENVREQVLNQKSPHSDSLLVISC